MKQQINISQYGYDGFGHQVYGLLTIIAMDGIRNYKFDPSAYVIRLFRFEHLSFFEKIFAWRYLCRSVVSYATSHEQFKIRMRRRLHSHEIYDIPTNHNQNVTYTLDNVFNPERILECDELEIFYKNLSSLKKVFVNDQLPVPRLSHPYIALHFRQGDALLYEKRKVEIIRFKEKLSVALQKLRADYHDYELIVHSDGPVEWIREEWSGKLIVAGRQQKILQVFSDLIHADILVTAPSALSSAAAWLSSGSKIITEDDLLLNANIDGCEDMGSFIGR